jgi:uncharacterized protein (TIGR00730 family)
VNCGCRPGSDPEYAAAARGLGEALVEHGIELVYGGACIGLMGEVADAVLRRGGTVIGIIPKSFAHRVAHEGLTELHVVDSMHDRKRMMFEMSDGFVALPGGLGTLEEISELLTWAQLRLHAKPCGLLNVGGYFDRLLGFLDHTVSQQFVKQQHRDMILVDTSPAALLDRLRGYRPPDAEKWAGMGGEDGSSS